MEPLAFLARARAQFEDRLRAVRPQDHHLPTPCPEWDVATLVEHVIAGDRMAAAVARGAGRDEGIAVMLAPPSTDDPTIAFARAADDLAAALAEPGAIERVVHHPVTDMPGGMLLGFRAGDYTYHAWDLARATGQDETLDPEVVAGLLAVVEQAAPRLVASGRFGTGASGDLAADAPAQDRLLDMVGRRP